MNVDFSGFKKFFDETASENKKYNVIDLENSISEHTPFQPNPQSFHPRDFEEDEDDEFEEEIGDIEDEERDIQLDLQIIDEEFGGNGRKQGLPNVFYTFVNNKPEIVPLKTRQFTLFKKKNVYEKVKEVYLELNKISLAIQTKLQFLKLDQFRKFTFEEFKEYSIRKKEIEGRLGVMQSDIRETIVKRTKVTNPEFESEKESSKYNGVWSKKKAKKKTREGTDHSNKLAISIL